MTKTTRPDRRLALLAALTFALGATAEGFGCGGSGKTSTQAQSTGGAGAGGGGGANASSGTFVGGTGGGAGGGTVACTTPCDAKTQVCSHGVCVPLVPCTSDNQCENDTKCNPAMGCVPWDGQMPPYDPNCVNVVTPGVLAPKVRCEFNAAPAGDAFPNHLDVQSTPVVVNFNNPGNSGPPSIVVNFTADVPATTTTKGDYTEDLGVIRVLRGTDCTLEANLGGVDLDNDGKVDWTVSSATVAVGDLDGDGSADVVAYGSDGATLAFTRKAGVWKLLWKAPYPAGAPWAPCDTTAHRCSLGWSGPSIYDIDDDGKPEVIREGVVFGSDGTLKSLQPTGYASYSQGLFSVMANLDQDPLVEMTNGQFVWKFMNGAWVQDMQYVGPAAPGQVAIANFGAYGKGVPADNPEIVVASNSTVAVYAITGEVAQPPVAVPGKGGGGPPTIGDFDGDGLPEVAIAGEGFYTVYDIDCGPNPRPGGTCLQGTCDFAANGVCPAGGYIAWSRASQDFSSNVTGSSVFDFDGSGVAKAVYADECFARVYDGKTGEVLFSQYHSSCTWYENPVVADVEGNFRSNLVVMSNKACAPAGQDSIACSMLDANGVDTLFAGLRCDTGADCSSGTCDSGPVPLHDGGRLLRGERRRGLPGGRLQVRAAPGRHAGHGQHLPRRAPARPLRHPRLLRRQRQVGALALHLEPARVRGHERERRRHRPPDQRLAEQLGSGGPQQLPPERARQRQRPRHRRSDRGSVEHLRVRRRQRRSHRARVQPRLGSHRRGAQRRLLRGRDEGLRRAHHRGPRPRHLRQRDLHLDVAPDHGGAGRERRRHRRRQHGLQGVQDRQRPRHRERRLLQAHELTGAAPG